MISNLERFIRIYRFSILYKIWESVSIGVSINVRSNSNGRISRSVCETIYSLDVSIGNVINVSIEIVMLISHSSHTIILVIVTHSKHE